MKLAAAILSILATGAGAATVTEVAYADGNDGSSLFGYLATPDGATEDDPRPAIIILGDWGGVDESEKERAEMFTNDGNYVTMAAAVYNSEDGPNPESFEDRIALATKYRSDPELSKSRVDAALAVLRENPLVDSSRVAIVGYCLGGSLGLNYALGGHEEIAAVAAFHGGINTVVAGDNDVLPVAPKVLLLSGGEDSQDSTASIIKIEDILNERNATWQITRYSDVDHGFALGEGYDPYVGHRSHQNFYGFVAEAFGETAFVADAPAVAGESVLPNWPTSVLSPDRTPLREVKYSTDDGFAMTGYVAVPENASDGPLPAVVIIQDNTKPTSTEYESVRATMLADLGYVAFAADVFGDDDGGHDLTDRSQLGPYMAELRVDDIDLANARVNAAIDAVKNIEGVNVDPDRIALTGYCFGGTVVINYATSGQTGAKGIVSFHGGLSQGVAPVEDGIHAPMLIQSGGDDDAGSHIEDLEGVMNSGGTKWEYSRYSGVEHVFTVWDHPHYNPTADVRSWEDMQTFLSDVFDGTLVVETDDSGAAEEPAWGGEWGGEVQDGDMTGEAEPAPVDSPEVDPEPSSTTKTSIEFSAAFSVILALAYHTRAL
mmetsp:Transcript_36677/g.87549  ORF Transcript_36677/g.87549 Transcript_36677/m.87549 type:complete len:602 (-) Transcript_36677:25-1830(-)